MPNNKCPKLQYDHYPISDDELGIHNDDGEEDDEREESEEEQNDEVNEDNGEEEEDEEENEEENEEEDGDEEEDEEQDDEDVDDDDTSSEASSMLNDMSVVPYRHVLTSSDESNQSGSGTYRTPPSTMGANDTEPLQFSTTVGHVRSEPSRNVARRQRARRPGVVAYRRGRWRQPVSEQEYVRLTPFAQGITFNGFARGYDPIEVVGYVCNSFDEILYKVNWRQDVQPWRPIESSVMRTYKPTMVIDYYESEVRRNNQGSYGPNFYSELGDDS